MLTALKTINLALAFILELAMLAAFVYWGFYTGSNLIVKMLLAIGLPVLVAVVWGIWMAPNSSRRLQGMSYLAVKLVLFGLAVAALFMAGQPAGGIVLAVVFIVNSVLLYVWR